MDAPPPPEKSAYFYLPRHLVVVPSRQHVGVVQRRSLVPARRYRQEEGEEGRRERRYNVGLVTYRRERRANDITSAKCVSVRVRIYATDERKRVSNEIKSGIAARSNRGSGRDSRAS